MIRSAAAAALLLALAGPGRAAPAPAVEVDAAWSRPVAAGLSVGVAYLTLVNHGRAPDRLEGASSPVAARVGLHRSAMSGGVMTMAAVPDGLELPPGQAVKLEPDGYHLMLEGLKAGLKPGETYPLTLRFAHAAPRTVRVEVRAPGDAPPMPGMKMP